MIQEVSTVAEFNQHLAEAGGKLVVVDFSASWCGPCQFIGPEFERLSALPENQNVVFLKVDVDEAQELSQKLNIHSMPTFYFYKKGQLVFKFSGADKNKLVSKVEELR